MARTFSQGYAGMNERHLILLLRLIHANANVDSLLRRGLTIGQVASMVNHAIDSSLLVQEGRKVILTPEGLKKILSETDTDRVRRDGGWIDKADEAMITKHSLDEVYLPPRGSSFFDT